ncbi:MAG: helix-turn-helix domain-containing protein [Alphaproteobacteria bacterium]|nr:helix-turn-helix domain-containing protein [Alphaproteobacteria bacterium]
MNESCLLTVAQVATHLQISIRQVRRLIKAKELEVLRIGRRIRIDPRDLNAFLERCRDD